MTGKFAHRVPALCIALFMAPCIALGPMSAAGDGKLLGTPAVTQVEGAGGTGIVPWAVLAGYASREQIAASAFGTRVHVDDLGLTSYGAAVNLFDRVELSFARQDLDVNPLGFAIQQNIFGAKVRVAGDIVYSRCPQVSVGIQHKSLDDDTVAQLLGARDDTGTDYYVAVSKLHLGAAFGYNLLWNLTARATRANEGGLLGYGGDAGDSHELMAEGSLALLVNRHVAVGIDYRMKPDNLAAVPEDHWADVFIALFPSKHLNVTVAWADLGNVAGLGKQRGVYLSLTGYIE